MKPVVIILIVGVALSAAFSLAASSFKGKSINATGLLTGSPVGTDTTLPGVWITSPRNASTLSGTVQVSADASDTSGIRSVQFLVDKDVLGEISRPPYSVFWNATSSGKGFHRITAIATDNSWNVDSNSIDVYVSI